MKAEKQLIFTGENRAEALEAIVRIRKFIVSNPELKCWRFFYVTIYDDNGVEHQIHEGSRDCDEKFFDKLADKANDLVANAEKFKGFYISGSVDQR